MFAAPGLFVRPEAVPPAASRTFFNRRRAVQTGLLRSLLMAGAGALLASPAFGTVLTIQNASVVHASGAFLPQGFPASITSSVAPSMSSVTMKGMVGPITRSDWQAAGVTNLRMRISGAVQQGVLAGDDVVFAVGLSILAQRGSVSWNIRGNANVPPAQGFIAGPSGTVQADPDQPVLVERSFGKSFLFDSTGDGSYSLYVDISWNGANPFETLQVELLYATVHLPAPSAAALLGIVLCGGARRRRREM